MATQSLYRRYRPRRFAEVKGQDHVVRALRSAVADGREGQAYLFSGPRGTGKTTTARILAKVLNCEQPVDGEPCCECASCVAVERGTSYDVHELDAASNNGVDAMRDLIEKASLGTPGRHKVYILDEVHMLSRGAEAALLKTLEEPPPHVVFVLATTDPQKMSDTIRSRTQHLQFHLLPADTLHEHVRWVAADAGLDVSEAALEQALARGGGSARDTLSALELVAGTGDGGLDIVPLDDFVESMIDRDPGRALTVVAHAITVGMDPRTLAEELVAFLRNGFLSLMAPELVQVPSARLDALAAQAQRLGAAGLVRGIETLGAALVEMRHAPDARVLLDVAAVQLTADAVGADVGALAARIDRLERQLASGAVTAAAPTVAPAAATPAPVDPSTGRAALGGRARAAAPPDAAPAAVPAPAVAPDLAPAPEPTAAPDPTPAPAPTTVESAAPPAPAPEPAATAPVVGGVITADTWETSVRPTLKGMARAVYAAVEFVRAGDGRVTLSVPPTMPIRKCEEQRAAVESAFAAHAGAAVTIELVAGDGPGDDDGGGRGGSDGGGGHDAGSHDGGRHGGGEGPEEPRRGRPAADALTAADDPGGVADVPAADEDVDLDDLVDAPPETYKSPLDRLAEAFPGSALIEEAS